MHVAVTGAGGFIGSNLVVRLHEASSTVVKIGRDCTPGEFLEALADVDVVVHLAGVNRPSDDSEFWRGNVDFTLKLTQSLISTGRPIPIIYSSSAQAAMDNPYGRSKRAAEEAVFDYQRTSGAPAHVMRLGNVFGKWARPFYNSVVATFCHQVAHGLPLTVHDPAVELNLVYVDDVVSFIIELMSNPAQAGGHLGGAEVGPTYRISVGELAVTLEGFASSRASLLSPRTGVGLVRALYATYLSHLRPENFSYGVPQHGDARGVFVEMLRTPDCGQFSYFTARVGATRGGHYHHTKAEKFLVIKGRARFGFRHILTGESYEVFAEGGDGRIIETIPGWTHDVANVGSDELVVMLWASENLDRGRPDTVAQRVKP